MATTQTPYKTVAWADRTVYAVDLTTMEPGVGVDVSYSGDGQLAGAEPFYVFHEVTVRPTSRDPVEISHIRASDSASGSTVRIVPDTIPAGDLAGCTVRLYIEFLNTGSGGLS